MKTLGQNSVEINTVADPEVQKGLAKVGVEPMHSSPEEYAALIKSESEKWAKVIKSANIKVD